MDLDVAMPLNRPHPDRGVQKVRSLMGIQAALVRDDNGHALRSEEVPSLKTLRSPDLLKDLLRTVMPDTRWLMDS